MTTLSVLVSQPGACAVPRASTTFTYAGHAVPATRRHAWSSATGVGQRCCFVAGHARHYPRLRLSA